MPQAVFQPDENIPYHIGLCWVLVPKFNIIYHNGGTRCFHTIVCINIEKKTAVTMLCNYPIEEVSNTAVSLLVELTKDNA